MSRRLCAITATCTFVLAGTAFAGGTSPLFSGTANAASPGYGAHPNGATRYRVTDLGTLGGTFSGPIDMNDGGEVTGVSVAAGDTALRGFVWRRGVLSDIGTLGGPQAGGVSINSSGQVGGWSDLTTPVGPSLFNQTELFCNPPMVEGQPTVACHAVLWENGKLTDLGTLGGQNSAAQNKGINDAGQVVGQAETSTVDPTGTQGSLKFHAFLWQRASREMGGHTKMIDLGSLGTDPDSLASSINNRGQVIGVSISNGSTFNGDNGRGFIWQDGRMTDLGTLGGAHSVPLAINNRGQVVGQSSLPGDGTGHATMWYRGRIVDLGILPGDVFSEALDITDEGQILGFSCSSTGCRAATWAEHEVTDLNTQISDTSGWQLGDAQAGNAGGQITGNGAHDDLSHAYLLTPVSRSRTP